MKNKTNYQFYSTPYFLSILIYFLFLFCSCSEREEIISRDSNGNIISKKVVANSDSLRYRYVYYNSNGFLLKITPYYGNYLDGEELFYDTAGNLLQKELYKMNNLIKTIKYYSNGKIKEECFVIKTDTIKNKLDSLNGINFSVTVQDSCKKYDENGDELK